MIKIYENGQEFYEDNKAILEKNPVDTSFFLNNARSLKAFDKENYAFKAYTASSYLLVLKVKPFNLLLYGSYSLCEEAVEAMCRYDFVLSGGILSEQHLALAFLDSYEKRRGGSHTLHLSMDIMYAPSCMPVEASAVDCCNVWDVSQIVMLRKNFHLEAVGMALTETEEEQKEIVEKALADFYCIRDKGSIVSIAKITRNEDNLCSISMVYTLPEYRCRGFSRKIVTKITRDILSWHKIPYLYVDKKNPISNHLYESIGYRYGNSKCEYVYEEDKR